MKFEITKHEKSPEFNLTLKKNSYSLNSHSFQTEYEVNKFKSYLNELLKTTPLDTVSYFTFDELFRHPIVLGATFYKLKAKDGTEFILGLAHSIDSTTNYKIVIQPYDLDWDCVPLDKSKKKYKELKKYPELVNMIKSIDKGYGFDISNESDNYDLSYSMFSYLLLREQK